MTLSFSRKTAWALWAIVSVFYAYQYVLRVMPNILLSDIMTRFQIDAITFGQFSGIYYIGYSLLHLPLGIMIDRFGPRKMMSACILLTVVGLSPLLFAHHWLFPIIGRFLIGLGSSAAVLGLFKIVRMAFAEERFSRMLSLSVTVGLAGAIYGGGPVNYMRESLGYDAVLYLFALAGILLALITYMIVPEMETTTQQGTILSDIKAVLGNNRVVLSCFFAGLMVGPLEGFADVWGSAFLQQFCGLEAATSASLPSFIFIGMCFGAPLLSLVAEKMGDALLTIIGSGFAMALGFTLLLTTSLSLASLSAIFVIIGVASAYQILAISKASTYVPSHISGLTAAVANMIIMIFGYVFHTLIGGVVNRMGGPLVKEALLYGIGVILVALCLGLVGFIFLYAQERKRQKGLAREGV